MSAEIIPFPRSPSLACPTGPRARGDERLAASLSGLEAALGEQRVAIALWRDALAELGGSVQAIETGALAFRERLAAVQAGLACLNGEQQRLIRWAETNGG